MIKKKIIFLLLVFSIFSICFAAKNNKKNKTVPANEKKSDTDINWKDTGRSVHDEVSILKKAYPQIEFVIDFDSEQNDYTVEVKRGNVSKVYYWCEGLYLPKEQLANKEKYYRVITNYINTLQDPAEFSEERIKAIKQFSSKENRKKSSFSSKFIFDTIYDAGNRKHTEWHLDQVKFLGKYCTVHEDIVAPLSRVEKSILELSKTNEDVKSFVDTLYSCQAYNWREIRDAGTRSFHSYGIAIDILPVKWTKKIIYWGFEKNEGNEDWMLIPVKDRWMPPESVIRAFENEGFIWGGYWAVWDNMHFEYHPELVIASKTLKK